PTFQDLMNPDMFVEPQFGMEVASAVAKGHAIEITTTGAVIHIDLDAGNISFDQRIGHTRRVAILRMRRPLQGAQITHKGRGFVRITCDTPKITLRVNGDSLAL